MKKLFLLTFLSSVIFAQTNDSDRIDQIIDKLDSIEERIEKIESLFSLSGQQELIEEYLESFKSVLSDDVSNDNEDEKEEVKIENFLEVVSWRAQKREKSSFDFDTYIDIHYSLRNITQKDIALVDGAITFDDKLDKRIVRLNLEEDLNLKSSNIKEFGGPYSVMSSFSGDISRITVIQKELVKITLDVDSLMFSDGEKIEFN